MTVEQILIEAIALRRLVTAIYNGDRLLLVYPLRVVSSSARSIWERPGAAPRSGGLGTTTGRALRNLPLPMRAFISQCGIGKRSR